MARFIMPVEQLGNSDFSGVASGWKLNFYVTGTTTRKDTFSDSALTTANANPVVADSAGRFGDIFLESGTYKVVLTDDSDTEIWTADPVDGAPGVSGATRSITASDTVVLTDSTKTLLVDATTGDVTITLIAAATAGDGFEVTVKKVDSTANNVTIDGNGAETIDGGATLVMTRQYQVAVLRCDASNWHLRNNPPLTRADTNVASAAALAVNIDGNFFNVTGTTAITSMNSKGLGAFIGLRFAAGLTLTHHATNLILPGGANIQTAAGDIALFEEYGSGTWRCQGYMRAGRKPGLPRYYIDEFGLQLSNNGTDADHDVDISAGACRSEEDTDDINLTSAITKQIDASWAVGSDAGGLDGTESVTGTPDANTTYHVWLIKRSDTGVVDALFSESATAPTMPSNYDLKRRIGSVATDGSANIFPFFQYGHEFRWVDRKLNVDDTTPDTSGILVTMSVPPGIEVMGLFASHLSDSANIQIAFTSAEETNTAPSNDFNDLSCTAGSEDANTEFRRKTNTSQQIRYRSSDATAAAFKIWTLGWIDPRGRDT